MAAQIDVYRDWLEISDADRPLDYYQLLKLKRFEDDAARIRAEYRKLNAHVRKYSAGEYAQQSQDLLNELAKAMLCLTDSVRKLEYDAALGRAEPQDSRRRSLEEILVRRKVLDTSGLDKARRYAKTVSVDVRDAVMQLKLAQPSLVMQAYAESVGLPYVDLNDVQIDAALAEKIPPVLARQHSLAPLLEDDGQALIVSPNPLTPDIEEQLRLRLGMPVRSVLCTPAGINDVIQKHYSRESAAAQMAAGGSSGSRPMIATVKNVAVGRVAAPAAVSDEDRKTAIKNRRLLAFVAFNFGLFGYTLLKFAIGFSPRATTMQTYRNAFAIGLVAAAVTYLVLKVRDK